MSVAPAKRTSRPSKTRRPAAQPPIKARAKSEELGDDEFMVRYNSRTGRPIRTSAGRKSLNPTMSIRMMPLRTFSTRLMSRAAVHLKPS